MIVAELAAKLGLKVDKGAWAEGTQRISAMKTAVAAGLTVALGLAVNEFKKLAEEAVDYGSKLDDANRKTGVSSQFLEELSYSAGGVSQKLDTVAGALTKFGLHLEDAVKNPTGDAAKALKELGISLDDPRVQLGDIEGVANQVAVAFESMSDGGQKNALAMALMGKTGPELSQALSELSEKRKEFAAVGGPLTNKGRMGLDAVGKSIAKLSRGWQALKTKAIAAVAPELRQLVNSITDFFVKNRAAITKTIGDVTRALASAVLAVVHAFQAVADWADRNKETISRVWAGLVLALKVTGQLIGWVVTKFIGLSEWLGETAAKVALWVSSVYDAVTGFLNGVRNIGLEIGAFFVGVGNGIKAAWEQIIGWIEEKVAWVTDKVEAITGVFSKIGKSIGNAGSAVGDFFTGNQPAPSGPTVTDAFTRGFAASAPPPVSSNNTTTINGAPVTVNVTPTPGMDVTELAKLVATKTREVIDMQLRAAHETLVTVGR